MATLKSTPPASGDAVTHSPASNLINVAHDLEKKIGQLNSLLYCSFGFGSEWMEEMGSEHRENIVWLMSDLCADIKGQYQDIEKFVLAKGMQHG